MQVLVKMATVEQAEWIVDKVDGNIPHTLDTPVDVSFMPTGGLGCWDLWCAVLGSHETM